MRRRRKIKRLNYRNEKRREDSRVRINVRKKTR